MNVIRVLKLFSLIKGLVKSDFSSAAGLMGEMHGLPQKLGQHFTLYPGQRYNEYFDELCTGGQQEIIPISEILKSMGIAFNKAEIYAQASIGQVYRVETDSRLLAIKVKYQDVEKRIRSDFALLKFLLWPFKFTPLRNSSLLPLIESLSSMLLNECQYIDEAQIQQEFHRLFAEDESVYVPEVISYDKRAIITEWAGGKSLGDAKASLGTWFIDGYLKFISKSLIHLRMIHADPHPGNFVISSGIGSLKENPGLVVLDFGSVVRFSDDEASAVCRLLQGEYTDEPELIKDLSALGVDSVTLDEYSSVAGDLVSILLEPFYYPDEYDFSQWRLQYKINTIMASRTWEKPFVIPPKLLLLIRTLQGLYFYARSNKVLFNWNEAVRKYMR